MEGGVYSLIGFVAARFFGWLDNRTKYSYDTELASLRLQNEALKAENVKHEMNIAALTQRVAQLETLLAAQLTARPTTTG